MTDLELLQAILDRLGELQTSIEGLLPFLENINTLLTFTVVVGAAVAVVWFILRPFVRLFLVRRCFLTVETASANFCDAGPDHDRHHR